VLAAYQADVTVLGAGLTGVSAALQLAKSGVNVTLLEQDERTMNRASLRNEGKIHLGFVFSQDLSAASSRLQLEGALRFRSLLSPLTGGRVDDLCLSHPFVYLVPEDSIATPDELGERFAGIDAFYREQCAEDPSLDYLGRKPDTLSWRIPLSDLKSHIRPDRFIGAFQTEEIAVDTEELAAVMHAAVLAESRIDFRPNHTVASVERANGRFRIEGTCNEGTFQVRSGQVINALWENRFKIDRTVGLEHEPGWLHRLKYRVIARLPQNMRSGPSTTLVVGPYGDVVVRADATAYFSWYPLGLRGWSEELAPPDDWNAPCRGELPAEERTSVAKALLEAIDQWYPGAALAEPIHVDAGAIVAYGRTDVGDLKSGLHDRKTHVGVTSRDGYHSVDPGKMTTCPYFGVRAAEAVLAERVTA
jgi:glycine/D-amino acid oxidase-like deaminating enzyme